MTRVELEAVRKWANNKLAGEQEPPWAWYQYMKLRETLDAILAGTEATQPMLPADSPELVEPPERHLRLVGSADSQDTARSRPTEKPVQLPM